MWLTHDNCECRCSGSGGSQQAFRDNLAHLLSLQGPAAAPLLTPGCQVPSILPTKASSPDISAGAPCLYLNWTAACHLLFGSVQQGSQRLSASRTYSKALPLSQWPTAAINAAGGVQSQGAALRSECRARGAPDLGPEEAAAHCLGACARNRPCTQGTRLRQLRAAPHVRQAPQC